MICVTATPTNKFSAANAVTATIYQGMLKFTRVTCTEFLFGNKPFSSAFETSEPKVHNIRIADVLRGSES